MPAAPRSLSAPAPERVRGLLLGMVALLISLFLHLTLASPWIAWLMVRANEVERPGEEDGAESGPVGDEGGEMELGEPAELVAPVHVSLYRPPGPGPVIEPEPAPPEPAPPRRTPPQRRPPPKKSEPTKEVVDKAEGGAATGSGGGKASKTGVAGKPPKGNKKPCEQVDEIVQINDTRWRVERDLVDWYATHLRELDKEGGVGTHKDERGKPDGARIYLPRCSVLRQAGLKNGDIIRTVEGKKVSTIPQALATYLAVRNRDDLVVKLTRKTGEELTLHYHLKR